MDRPLLSIIIPVYNAEKYLREAVCSVTGQAFSDYEILLVEDVSTDGSLKLAEELAEADARIRVLRQPENSGAAAARNRGIREAAGRYLMFLDADDAYREGLLEQVAEAAAGEPEVILWGAAEEYLDAEEQLTREVIYRFPGMSLKTAQEVRTAVIYLEKNTLYGYLWNKAYRADIIGEKKIPRQPFNEDEMFNMHVFMDVQSVEILYTAGTRYRIRPAGSLTHREIPAYYPVAMRRVKGLMLQHKIWGLYTPEVRQIIADIYVRYTASALERNCHAAMHMDLKQQYQFIRDLYQDSLYRELIPYAKPENPGLRALAVSLRMKNTPAVLAAAKVLYAVKTGDPERFSREKDGKHEA